jgi:MFS family permease
MGATGARAAPGAGARRASAWNPLRHPVFRALWLASCASNVGTWMHDTSAAWLMTGLAPSPLMVSLMQTATSLPFFLLALPAGALADIVDRRRLLIGTQVWMLVAATALGGVTVLHLVNPWTLLALTFCIGLGNALNAPAWQATTPELVPREELVDAIALSGISVNVARAVGPALGGLLVAAMGAGWVFLLNAASFLGVVAMLARWRPAATTTSRLPPEDVPGAMRSGVRYIRHAAPFHAVLMRTAAFVVPASALWALLPLFARRGLELSATGYGLLLGCLGTGAIAGAVCLPRIRDRVTSDRLVVIATVVFAAVSLVVALARAPVVAGVGLFAGGVAWMAAMSTLNVAAQNAVPAWVRARALAVGLLALQGGMAVGSLVWGVVAQHTSVPVALAAGAVTLVLGAIVTTRFELHGLSNLDLRPDPRWTLPQTACELDGDEGPVLVTLEYHVDPADENAFLHAVRRLEAIRRRDGAIRWNVYQDTEDPKRWVETFVVESWLEHLRQHERVTAGDRVALDAAARFHRGDGGPRVRHHIAGRQEERLRREPRPE